MQLLSEFVQGCIIFSGEGCKELKSMTWKQMKEVVANCEDFCKVYDRIPYFYITGGVQAPSDKTAEQLFGYEQVAKRIANIRLTLMK